MNRYSFYSRRFSPLTPVRMLAILILLVALAMIQWGCSKQSPSPDTSANWINLFDGSYMSHYEIFAFPDADRSRWTAENSVLSLAARPEGSNSKLDLIITDKPVGDFEFSFEWNMSPGGNGGIFYMVKDDPKYLKPWHTGLEMQLLDDAGHEEGLIVTHRSGDLYDLIASNKDTTLPAGDWNQSRIVRRGKEVEQWMNGNLSVSFTIGSDKWNGLIGNSKYAEWPEYGKIDKGHLVLQDHGDQISFRNLKLKEL